MPQESGLSPLARQIMARLGIAAPVRAEETVNVTAPNPPHAMENEEKWWKAPHRGQAAEILLGSKTKHPTGVYRDEERVKDVNNYREKALTPELRAKYPNAAAAWDEVTSNHPHITRYVRNFIPTDKQNDSTGGSMRWNMFNGGPDIILNNTDKPKEELVGTLKHELAHVGQQLNWPTYPENEKHNFGPKEYMARPGELQAFDLSAEEDQKVGRGTPRFIYKDTSENEPGRRYRYEMVEPSIYNILIKRLLK
jgi:hypothetical protein